MEVIAGRARHHNMSQTMRSELITQIICSEFFCVCYTGILCNFGLINNPGNFSGVIAGPDFFGGGAILDPSCLFGDFSVMRVRLGFLF